MNFKRFARDWLPPVGVRAALRLLRSDSIRFEGNYPTWEAAEDQCTGYDTGHILTKVLEATLKVKRGQAAYERDSVLFDEIEYVWPVTAALMWAAAQSGGKVDILDFGGALGSSYFQNRAFLKNIPQVRWSVIEQAHFVEAGREHIQDETLRFYSSIDDCLLENKPNIILLSGVLQYLPDPKSILNKLATLEAGYLIIDRTPFLNTNTSQTIKVQHVPSSIYLASYPCWFFNFTDFIDYVTSLGYQKFEMFSAQDKTYDFASWQGFIFKKSISK